MSITVASRTPMSVSRRTSLTHFGPNWFAAVMGTGIVANAAATLPVHVPGVEKLALGMWILASALLIVMLAATVAHWAAHPVAARGHLAHPVMSHFYGAPAMALMTVGAGAMLIGHELIGLHAAVTLDIVLWTAGTTLGLWTTCAIPRRMFRRADPYAGPAFGGWLMPVVPAMVSAATGALLVPHLPPTFRPTMIAACYVLFIVALAASLPLIVMIVRRALTGYLGAAATIPTLFIVLGPLGQSVTAAHVLGDEAGGRFVTAGVVYGVPVLISAMLWLIIATTLVVRTSRTGLSFSLTWWSFTFPVGTLVTGTSGVAAISGVPILEDAAVVLFAILVCAWAAVATLTVRGAWSGRLLPRQTA